MTINPPVPPAGFLYAFLTPSVQGGTLSIDGTNRTRTGTDTPEDFVTWATMFEDDVLDPYASGTVAWSTTTGEVTINTGSASAVLFQDQTGILMGWNRQPGEALGTGAAVTSEVIPAGAIHLMGCEVQDITIERDVILETYRHMRVGGYHFGGVKLFRCDLTMHQASLRALDYGWCSSGRVRISMNEDHAAKIDATNSDGYIQGWVLGVEQARPLTHTLDIYGVGLVLAVENY